MPELPEVEAARRLVQSHCLGGVIVAAVVADDNKVIEGVSQSALQEALTGKKILSAHRKGKHLWLQLDSPPWPSFQFGMSGAFIVKGIKGPQYRSSKVKDTEDFPSPYSKVHLQLDSGVEVAFTDKRRFARVRLLPDPTKVVPISDLGFDAYTELPSGEEFVKALQARKVSVKALLLDQSFLAGIGNWVADEVLYQAKIHPEQPANKLTDEECKQLHTTIKEVLEKAVAVDADSEQFPPQWLFHHRWDRKPGLIEGNQIEQITISGRTSAFVPAVQKYSGPELKGAKKKAAIDEEIPHDGEGSGSYFVADENPEGATSKKMNTGAEAVEAPDAATGDKDVGAGKEGGVSEPKRRGRPPKAKTGAAAAKPAAGAAGDNASPASGKKRGRPPKLKTSATADGAKKEVEEAQNSAVQTEAKRRGRPPKAKPDDAAAATEAVSKAAQEAPAKKAEKESDEDDALNDKPAEGGAKRRGRPPKAKADNASTSQVDKPGAEKAGGSAEPKRRGRPPKAKDEAADDSGIPKKAKVGEGDAAVSVAVEPKRKGRPPKAKPDLKAKDADAGASVKGKEEDKGDGDAVKAAAPKKRGRPPKAKPGSA